MELENDFQTVRQEAIVTQFKDIGFIDELANIYRDLLDGYDNHNTLSNTDYLKRRDSRDWLYEIDRIIQRRFGFNTKHISGPGFYGITTTTPNTVSVLNKHLNVTVKDMERGIRGHKYNPNKEVTDLESDYRDVIATIINNHRELTKVMNTTGVVIDEENARIRGLPTTMEIYAIINIRGLYHIGATPMECVATLLHEIGHVFTHISESYRSIRFVDTFIEAMSEGKNMSKGRKFRILNKKMFGGSKILSDNDNELTAFIKISKKALTDIYSVDASDVELSVESERMADQFSSRFGLGKEIVTLLEKIGETPTLGIHRSEHGYLIRIMFIIFIFGGLVSVASFIMFFAMWMTIFTLLGIILGAMIFGGEKVFRFKTYDEAYRRIERIMLDNIRQLRLASGNNLPEALRVELRYNIQTMKEILETKSDWKLVDKIAKLVPWNWGRIITTDLNRNVDRTIDNILHSTMVEGT